MTGEEMQRTMESIVAQQAQFASNIQRLDEERIRDRPASRGWKIRSSYLCN